MTATMPPIGQLQPSLAVITETLARAVAQPGGKVPAWSKQEWILARAVAASHGVGPLLWVNQSCRGPDAWMKFLEQQASHTRQRHVRIAELLRILHDWTGAEGIASVALKGVALHTMGLYRAGERPMADIDLLVRPRDAERMAELLCALEYRESSKSWKDWEFTPTGSGVQAQLGEHANNHIKIELHDRICEKLPLRIIAITDRVFHGKTVAGLNDYPSKASLMLHLLLHAAGAIVHQSLRLIQLYDLALLAARFKKYDWEELFADRAPGSLWWIFPPLKLTARYFNAAVPAEVLAAAARDCPRFLARVSSRRRLSDVSYSHLRVDAFPGIEWSQSLPLAVEYAWNRIRPSAEHITLRASVQSSGWAAGDEWSSLPQGRRILRWLGSRPARPAAMHPVRAAFEAWQW